MALLLGKYLFNQDLLSIWLARLWTRLRSGELDHRAGEGGLDVTPYHYCHRRHHNLIVTVIVPFGRSKMTPSMTLGLISTLLGAI